MNVTLAPMSPRVAVRPADDPYKKYWWLILGGFALTAGWLLLPMMEPSVGSARVGASAPAEAASSGEGSLDGSDNPSGAPGSALDLAMDVARPRKADGAATSSLYQAPEDPAAPVDSPTSGAAAAGGTLASALKKAAGSDPSGWGGQKAQKGFTSPKLSGASAPGLGGGGGGGGASAGFSAARVGAFGSQNAQVGFAGARGLSGGVSELPQAKSARGALSNAASMAVQAANLKSQDGQVGGLSRVFDGRSQSGGSAIAGGGAALGAGGVYDSLDAAPSNLKINDPDLDKREFTAPPAEVANSDDNRSDELKQQIAMMVVSTVVGGVVGGVAGNIITTIVMQMNQPDRKSATTGTTQN